MIPRPSRRRFLASAAGFTALAGAFARGSRAADPAPSSDPATNSTRSAEAGRQGRIMTVTGPVPTEGLGRMLPHEHVTTDFLGAEKAPGRRYDLEQAVTLIRPHLDDLRRHQVKVLVECTPAYIGRDVRLLRRLSELTGVRVVTNTGYYGGVENRFLPRHAFTETVEQLAARWLAEWRDGIDGTGIRPGFLKLGTGNGALPELHVRLLRAACAVHRQSGLPIAFHTGDGLAARDEVRILEEERVSPDALVWVHAQNDPGPIQLELARRGVWVSLDGYSLATMNPVRYRNFLVAHRDAGTLGQVLISHDDGWAVEGEALEGATLKLFGNGNPRPYSSLFERLLPDLQMAGFTEADLDQLLVRNPARAFALRSVAA